MQAGPIGYQHVLQPQPSQRWGGISSVPFLLPGSRAPQNMGALPISSWVRTSFRCPYSQGPWFRGGSGEGGHRGRQKKGIQLIGMTEGKAELGRGCEP